MKAALNGVVNVSILDGWWCEGYSEETGFAIGGDWIASNDDAQDAADAAALFESLEQQVLPTFYDDRPRWVGLMRNSIAQLGARFNTNRMLIEYVERLYLPAHRERRGAATTA
jgi:starch phosphorylase